MIARRSSARGVRQGWGVKTSYFRANSVNISETVGNSPKLLLMTNRKLHMRFRLTPVLWYCWLGLWPVKPFPI